MSVTLTYEDDLSRVKVVANGFDVIATVALVERSLDQVTWTTVRCGFDAPVVSGSVTVFDYEFSSDVANYYRVGTLQSPTFVAVGAAAHANNASVSPALPAGLQPGDQLFVLAAIRNSGTGTVNEPAGYMTAINASNVKLFMKEAVLGEVAPTITFTGGVANASTSAQTAAFRNLSLESVGANSALNGSAQNITVPALTFPAQTQGSVIWIGWKQDDWTSVDPVTNGTEIGEPDTTLGDDQGIVWDYRFISPTTSFITVSATTFVVTGGASAISRGGVTMFKYSSQIQTSSITPTLDRIWIKSIGSPFLNRGFNCVVNFSAIGRDDRAGIFEIINRSFPVAVTDLRQSREFSVDVVTQTTQQHDDFDFAMALGEPIFLHTPASSPIPTVHAVVRRVTDSRPLLTKLCGNDWHVFNLPLREVAPPGADVCGSTITWQGVVNSYVTWQAVLNGETSWFDLLQNIGSPADVIVT